MKILEIIPSLSVVGGGETFFVSLCNELYKKSDVQIVAVTLYSKSNSFLDNSLNNEIKRYSLNKKRGIDFKTATALRKIIKKEKPDVIHCHLATTATLFLAIPFNRKIKIFFTLHNMVGDGFKKERLNVFLSRINFMKVIGVSKIVASSFAKKVRKNIEFINNGIDLEKYNPTKNINDRKIDFLCVGSFSPVKNQEFIIKCFKEANINGNLTFLGDGVNLEKCKRLVEQYDLNKKIIFKGCVNNVNEYMEDSKVLLIGSTSEANPIVVNEALCSGMFILSTNVGGLPDLINENNGVLINNFSLKDYSNQIKCLYNDEFFLEEKRLINLKNTKNYSIKKCAHLYLSSFADEK